MFNILSFAARYSCRNKRHMAEAHTRKNTASSPSATNWPSTSRSKIPRDRMASLHKRATQIYATQEKSARKRADLACLFWAPQINLQISPAKRAPTCEEAYENRCLELIVASYVACYHKAAVYIAAIYDVEAHTIENLLLNSMQRANEKKNTRAPPQQQLQQLAASENKEQQSQRNDSNSAQPR
jgi:hypothetical protein